jgi:hypothetical protein
MPDPNALGAGCFITPRADLPGQCAHFNATLARRIKNPLGGTLEFYARETEMTITLGTGEPTYHEAGNWRMLPVGWKSGRVASVVGIPRTDLSF